MSPSCLPGWLYFATACQDMRRPRGMTTTLMKRGEIRLAGTNVVINERDSAQTLAGRQGGSVRSTHRWKFSHAPEPGRSAGVKDGALRRPRDQQPRNDEPARLRDG